MPSSWCSVNITLRIETKSIDANFQVSFLDESSPRRRSRQYFRGGTADSSIDVEAKHKSGKKPKSKQHELQHLMATRRSKYPTFRVKPYTFPLFYPYVMTKLAYLLVIAANFAFLTWTFNFNYLEYGWRALLILSSSQDGAMDTAALDAAYFPKRAFCNVKFYR